MKSRLITTLFLLLIFSISSCVKKLPIQENPITDYNDETILSGLTINEHFDWETSNIVNSSIQTLSNTGTAIPNIKVSLFTDYEIFDGKEIISGYTNANGLFEIDYRFASATDSLVVATDYLGFVTEVKVPIIAGKLNYIFGGIPAESNIVGVAPSYKSTEDFDDIDLNFLGSWDDDGVPSYLVSPRDDITYDFLIDINSSLPSKESVPDNHPEYLFDSYEQTITLTETANIWITFVSEGSKDRNTLAYYTFDSNNPPEDDNDITECTVIFPNASFKRSKGGLYSGDKVDLGQFSAGTSIGWLLITDAYDKKDYIVEEGDDYIFSHKVLNELSDSPYQQHIVMLKDINRERFIIAFEESERPKKDEDFNDNIFYATVSPVSAIEDGLYPTIGSNVVDNDRDDDGVDNTFDDYPDDNTKAFNNYYPSKTNLATLAFEDLWPSKGDYDFNTITNANNDVVKLEGEFIVRAIGAGFHNGFGFELKNILTGQVSAASGSSLQEGYINLNSNGTEAGQTNATIIVFDNAKNLGYWNTDPTSPFITPTEIVNIDITLTLESMNKKIEGQLTTFSNSNTCITTMQLL
jgi:hypothetical protein